MNETPAYRRKLIEVDLPLDEINRESAREKSIRHGHPSTLHLWWARRPLAACRAVIFASMVDDPSSCADEFPTEEEQQAERERLHDMIKKLVIWENTDERNPEVRLLLAEARYEIARSVARGRNHTPPDEQKPLEVLRYLNDNALPIYDPFAGGGSIPLEAQRLGLRAVASDLNPIAVLINKALIELPPKFNNRPPVNPDADPMGMTTGKFVGRGKNRKPEQIPWRGAAGLADDIRYYGRWMREKAFERIGHLYPKAKLPDGGEATVIAWLWARTIPCSNPACGIRMPLMKTFQLSRKTGNQHWTRPVVDRASNSISFEVQNHDTGVPDSGTVNRNGATCIACNATAPLAYVREQSRAGNMDEQMTAIVAEGNRKRLFLSPTEEHVRATVLANAKWRPSGRLPDRALSIRPQIYGLAQWHQLFTKRQLTALTTFSDLLPEIHSAIIQDRMVEEYLDAVHTYLALAVGRSADSSSSFARWQNSGDKVAGVFARQGIPMIWDFAETNPFSASTQNWMGQIAWIAGVVERLPPGIASGEAQQADASINIPAATGPVIVTDPPYYDNIHYADSSDFFYVWLRPLLRDIYPDLFAGILTPKDEEMVANRFRFKDHRQHFEDTLSKTLKLIRQRCADELPSSIFYAYKQQEEERDGRTSTGWEAMLSALVSAGFMIIGTWPMRTERSARVNALSANSLASSVVLVCRPRPADAPVATRRQFLDALERELPVALDHLTRDGHIAPVDLAQAAIGPGMEIYSRYSGVETISGERVTVRDALAAINEARDRYLEGQEGELDSESRFCLGWHERHGYRGGGFGEAEVLSQATNVAIESMDGLLTAEAGKVQLSGLEEYGTDRQPSLGRMTAWEGCMRMAWHFDHEYGGGIKGAAQVGACHARNRRRRGVGRASGAHPLQPIRQPGRLPKRGDVQHTRHLMAGDNHTDAGRCPNRKTPLIFRLQGASAITRRRSLSCTGWSAIGVRSGARMYGGFRRTAPECTRSGCRPDRRTRRSACTSAYQRPASGRGC